MSSLLLVNLNSLPHRARLARTVPAVAEFLITAGQRSSWRLPVVAALAILPFWAAVAVAEQTSTPSSVIGGLSYEDLGKEFNVDLTTLTPGLYHHIERDREVCGGNTSLRHESEASLVWKGHPNDNGHGYFQRNRDLGQIVNVPDGPPRSPQSLVLRTAKGNNALMSGVPGSRLYVQWFLVEPDEPSITIDDLGTPQGSRAKHGFDHAYHRADDVIRGVRYRPLVRFVGATVPEDVPTTDRYVYDRGRGDPFGEQPGHLRFFRLTFPKDHGFVLEPNRRYAWLLGFESPGTNRGIGLANRTAVHSQEPPEILKDEAGELTWCIRREGNGQLPPTMIRQSEPPRAPEVREQLISESLFGSSHFDRLMPTSDGYPDVDTYRTYQFYLHTDP